MIRESSIQEVRERINIAEVIGASVELKKRGAQYEACCPFHGEKTPSFKVNPAKEIFKCFGCGEGGDAIAYVMKHERKTFFEAIEWLAAFYNINLEFDESGYTKEEAQEKREAKQLMYDVVQYAQVSYAKMLFSLPADSPAKNYLQTQRGYSTETLLDWGIGFAPDDWKFLTGPVINKGWYTPAHDIGLVQTKNTTNYDFLRNRITIPIYNQHGLLCGIAGRLLPEANAEGPKYVNPAESGIYNKKKIWYGLNRALKAIKEKGFVIITEGYFDVISLHEHGAANTVAACGTEVDIQQAKALRKHTDEALLMLDGDAPGIKKTMKMIDVFLQAGFKTNVATLPEGMDPDEWVRSMNNGQLTIDNS